MCVCVLVLEVLHQALHVPQLPVQFGFVVVHQVVLPPQHRHVGLEQRLHVGATHALRLQQLQLRLQHLVLLLQKTHLDQAGEGPISRGNHQQVPLVSVTLVSGNPATFNPDLVES